MNAANVFVTFVTCVLDPAKAKRFAVLALTKKGQRKVLDMLCHEFELAVSETALRSKDYSVLWERPCFVFHSRVGFGVEFPRVQDAYDELAIEDCWLIVLRDASAGIHRPEAHWDHEAIIIA